MFCAVDLICWIVRGINAIRTPSQTQSSSQSQYLSMSKDTEHEAVEHEAVDASQC